MYHLAIVISIFIILCLLSLWKRISKFWLICAIFLSISLAVVIDFDFLETSTRNTVIISSVAVICLYLGIESNIKSLSIKHGKLQAKVVKDTEDSNEGD